MNHSLDNTISYEELVRMKARAIPQNRMKEFLDSLSVKGPEALQQFVQTTPQMYAQPGHCIYSENADVAGSLLELARPIGSPLQQDGVSGGQSPQVTLQMKSPSISCQQIPVLQAESPQGSAEAAVAAQSLQAQHQQLQLQQQIQNQHVLLQAHASPLHQQQTLTGQSPPPASGSPPQEQISAKVGERRQLVTASSGVLQPVKKRKVDIPSSVSYAITQQPMQSAVATVLALPTSATAVGQQQSYIPVHQELLTVDSSQLYASNAISPSQAETWTIYTPQTSACGEVAPSVHTSLSQEAYSIVQVTPGQATVLGLRGAEDKDCGAVVTKAAQEVIHAIGTPVFAPQFVNGSIQLPVAVQASGNIYTPTQATHYWEPQQHLQAQALQAAAGEQPGHGTVELVQAESAAPTEMILADSLKPEDGLRLWRLWAQTKNAEIDKEVETNPPLPGRRPPLRFKEDIVSAAVAELNYGLCLLVREARKPDGEEHEPDALYFLILSLQKYLFDNGRVDNIFTDVYYNKFTERLHEVLKTWQPRVSPLGFIIPSQITEEMLWECKQLGAHSPATLLNTLMYFNTKYFMLKTVEQHSKLAFSRVLKQTKKNPNSVKDRTASIRYLRNYGQIQAGQKITDDMYAEQPENVENPLRCPIKLYDFYLFKCPQSVKGKSDMFYLTPEPVVAPNSPIWYSSQPVNSTVMEHMLTRILLVREVLEAHSSSGLQSW
uniref:transcriptional regulator QRICH1 n=1 Tax=Myxine glutinosa TaxID=7769 RepID=UPI00358FDF2F